MFTRFPSVLRLWLLLWLMAAPVAADVLPPLPPGEAQKWRAIGVVNIEGIHGLARCTGTLIAPDLVLSAAHCAPLDPAQRVFVVEGSAAAFAIKKVQHHPAYAGASGFSKYRVDQALITLQQPVPPDLARPLPLLMTPLPDRGNFGILGYHRLRPGHLNGRFDCAQQESADMILNCQVIAGNSGAPVLSKTPSGWQIAGVVVARLGTGATQHALIAPINPWLRAKLASHLRRRE